MLRRPLCFLRSSPGRPILSALVSFQRQNGQDAARSELKPKEDRNSEARRYWIAGALTVAVLGFVWNNER